MEEQDSNFITRLHKGHISIIPWPVIESTKFYSTRMCLACQSRPCIPGVHWPCDRFRPRSFVRSCSHTITLLPCPLDAHSRKSTSYSDRKPRYPQAM
ncbi:hypothetical protein JB92DRAFT_2927694 [Gautieria morchelliformis]|nr:hypothetical protein JB92DRAFT_2966990 [Gautieria morchelliformis]KAF8512570.1 hypothetical protein JB92DRAFT_2927694 [Gautieria morchelliformis]